MTRRTRPDGRAGDPRDPGRAAAPREGQSLARDPSAAGIQPVRAAAVTLLARHDYSSAALRERLERQGFEPALVTAALAELAAEHALDDARYARNYVTYHAGRGQGPERIAADLAARGVPAGLIEAALGSGADWSALARHVRVRKFGADLPGSSAERDRQARFLQYRGFSSDHIRSVLGPDFTPEE